MSKKILLSLVIAVILLTWSSASSAGEGYGRGKHGAVYAMTNDNVDNANPKNSVSAGVTSPVTVGRRDVRDITPSMSLST